GDHVDPGGHQRPCSADRRYILAAVVWAYAVRKVAHGFALAGFSGPASDHSATDCGLYLGAEAATAVRGAVFQPGSRACGTASSFTPATPSSICPVSPRAR